MDALKALELWKHTLETEFSKHVFIVNFEPYYSIIRTALNRRAEPLPAKPEDVREELREFITDYMEGREQEQWPIDATQLADAILAKFPKMLEGT